MSGTRKLQRGESAAGPPEPAPEVIERPGVPEPAAAREAAAALTEATREDFAVLVPAFDEAPVIGEAVRALRDAFERYGLRGEVVVIDDGSRDGTGDEALRAAGGWDSLTVVRHRANLGKTEAMVTGAEHTERTFLVLFDADLQHLPDEIPRFLEKLQEGWDIVTGRKVGAYGKRGVSSVYNTLSRLIFRVPVSDLNSMKAFRRDVLEELHLRHDWHRFFVVLAHARGWKVTEIDIELFPRRAGTPKYQGRFRIVVGLLDLISVWFLLLFSRKPLLLFGTGGVALIGLGLVVGAVAFYLRFVEELGFRPLLYLVILLETVGF
ncbi:MAG TPA: glycosyltransferase family 2 protein, partial [Longimicrobiales bacterium]|nr:glycosyltransferase family 2 protein [Longimicrobiales bacterium]